MSGNSQQRKRFKDAVERMAAEVVAKIGMSTSVPPPTLPSPPEPILKKFKWKDLRQADIVTDIALSIFFSLGMAMLGSDHLLAAKISFGISGFLLLIKDYMWSAGYSKSHRMRPFLIGLVFWVVLCAPLTWYLYLQDRPAFLSVLPFSWDSDHESTDFVVVPAWKPLTQVEIVLVDQSVALAVKASPGDSMTVRYPEVSSNYVLKRFVWKRLVAPDRRIQDSYLFLVSSHEGTYSEVLDFHRLDNGKESYEVKVFDTKNLMVFRCADFPVSLARPKELKDVPRCVDSIF